MYTKLDRQDAKSFGIIASKLELLKDSSNLTDFQKKQIGTALSTLDNLFIKSEENISSIFSYACFDSIFIQILPSSIVQYLSTLFINFSSAKADSIIGEIGRAHV